MSWNALCSVCAMVFTTIQDEICSCSPLNMCPNDDFSWVITDPKYSMHELDCMYAPHCFLTVFHDDVQVALFMDDLAHFAADMGRQCRTQAQEMRSARSKGC
jgi:hypothetical protein